MQPYLELLERVYTTGKDLTNKRTGEVTRRLLGQHVTYDLTQGFPVVTTKFLAVKSCIGEMIGFMRGYDNAADFRALGCQVWNANANENEQWLKNPYRKGTDDLGRIYGVQARNWRVPSPVLNETYGIYPLLKVDQVKNLLDKLRAYNDDRRLIVSHWNPAELNMGALPPCHLLYQCSIDEDELFMSLYIRSNDLFLGNPFNTAGYAWLTYFLAHMSGLKPGGLSIYMHDAHIYHNHFEAVETQLSRKDQKYPLPIMRHEGVELSSDMCFHSTIHAMRPEHFILDGYSYHPSIKAPMAV